MLQGFVVSSGSAEVIDMVVAPRHGVKVIEEAARLGVKNIWLQPGLITKKLWSLLKARVECSSGVRACGVEIETCSFATAGLWYGKLIRSVSWHLTKSGNFTVSLNICRRIDVDGFNYSALEFWPFGSCHWFSSQSWMGSDIINSLPLFSLLLTFITPLWRATKDFTMERPIPLPSISAVRPFLPAGNVQK